MATRKYQNLTKDGRISTRKYSYKFLTMGGRRFVALTPERFNRLFKKEQEAIERTAKLTGEDLRTWTKETWLQLGATKEIRQSAYRRAIGITEGSVADEVFLDIGRAYAKALEEANRPDLANRIAHMFNDMLERRTDMIDMFINELPNIHAIYAEKGRNFTAQRSQAIRMTREDSLPEIELIISQYEKELYQE